MKKYGYISLIMFFLFFTAQANSNKTICGQDDRVPSTNPKIGRLLENISASGGCTLTMIGKSCAITAGHCSQTFGVAEFNTPMSDSQGRIQHPRAEDIYMIDRNGSQFVYSTIGDDWAVIMVKPNEITGKYAGDVQGFYEVDFNTPLKGDIVRITGYGLDRSEPERNLSQQTHVGEITRLRGSAMYHIADTMGGNSGSSIIRESDEKIIGIHTNGGCTRSGGANSSTSISENKKLTKAIKACLAQELLFD